MYLKANAFLQIGDIIIEFDKYNFSWKINVENDDKPNLLDVTISNLSKEFRSNLSQGMGVIFSFGFNGKIDTVFQGFIDTYKTKLISEVTNQTQIKAISIVPNAYNNISTSFSGENKTSEIIKLLANDSNFIINKLELENDVVHKNGYVVIGKFINIIRNLVEISGSVIEIEGDIITITNPNSTEKTNAKVIDFTNGLLSEPQLFEEKDKKYNYKISMIADLSLRKNAIFYIKSETIESFVKIIKYNISDFIGEYDVATLEV